MKCDGWDIDPPDDRKRYSIDDNSWKFWFCFVVEAVKVARGPLRNPFTTAGPRVRWRSCGPIPAAADHGARIGFLSLWLARSR
ncbi:hypothetical protein FD510_06690 [Cutibacterium acnes]|nr:hypothetical protein FD510_06690 [Cutibacterium acnes]TLG36129.1 hypothetical protein FD511_06355 [Cutibacterium acnes]TLG36797.1 hypothetical protein FD508_06680 [Cutibacterium acnes]TLG39380.1 hypothetical protein FD512_03245 [Cutibacterium acnes]TLG42136.1 hypothetical protein FD509_08005 [Cutibacterium acnes]